MVRIGEAGTYISVKETKDKIVLGFLVGLSNKGKGNKEGVITKL